jgi:hypothetical protein
LRLAKFFANAADLVHLKDESARRFFFAAVNPACLSDARNEIIESLLLHFDRVRAVINFA